MDFLRSAHEYSAPSVWRLGLPRGDGMHLARVAELVDALDLGSSTQKVWGFDSPLSHHCPHHVSPHVERMLACFVLQACYLAQGSKVK